MDRLPTLTLAAPEAPALNVTAPGTVLLSYRFGGAEGEEGSNGIDWTAIGAPFTEAMWIEVRTDGETLYEEAEGVREQRCGAFCQYPEPPFGSAGRVPGNGMGGPHHGGVDIVMYWPSGPAGSVPNDNDYNVENGQRVRLIYTLRTLSPPVQLRVAAAMVAQAA